MATFRSKHTNAEIEAILDAAEVSVEKPFCLYYDTVEKKYRFFATSEKKDAWVYARDNDILTDEIRNYEFTINFDAPAPNKIIVQWPNNDSVRSVKCDSSGNTSGVTLDYTFRTESDKDGSRVSESVNVIYTIVSPNGTNTISVTYLPDVSASAANTAVSFNIDDYISIGTNTISIVIKGRTSGVTKTEIASITVFKLALTSKFNIASAILPNTDIKVPFMVEGTGDKVLHIWIDGTDEVTRQISSMESNSEISETIKNTTGKYGIGKHNLQMYLSSNGNYSNILYFEFVISGTIPVVNDDGSITYTHQRQILIETTIDIEDNPSESLFKASGTVTGPTIYGTQYYPTEISYAFYSSDTSNEYRAQIQWKINESGLQIQPVDIDSIEETKVGTKRTLSVIPMNSSESVTDSDGNLTGKFQLQAYMKKSTDTEYSLIDEATYPYVVAANTDILEAQGALLKLSAYGRSNNENSSTKTTWENNGYSTEFSSSTDHVFEWSGDYGWSDGALGVKAGTWCRINNKPFADAPQNYNGCTFEIEFMTFDVDDENSVLLSIGDPSSNSTASFAIKGTSAILKSQNNVSFETKFKTNERVKLAFILYPNDSGTGYAGMVFIQVNGILSKCGTYDVGDDFTIGYAASTSDTNGMIKIGDTDCSSSIKIYNIRVYEKCLNIYEELSNYIIDRAMFTTSDNTETMTYKISHNDIYNNDAKTEIDTTKLADQITVVTIDGDITPILDAKSKNEVEVAMTVTSPTDPAINITSPHTKVSNAGQSTLGLPVPSMHVKLGAYDNNVVLDADGAALVGNRWSFISESEDDDRRSNVPEKKFRLQANYMDSSGCHNGAFLKLFNTVSKKVKINDKLVLLPPSMRLIYDTGSSGYAALMKAKHGDNPNSSDGEWEFPYEMNMVPDSIPCVVVWKNGNTTKFLGQYVIMEEKKADFASGKRSIYSNIDSNRKPDPFTFKTSKDKNNTLWDNSNVRQFEIVNNVGSLTYFNSISAWDEASLSGTYRYESDFEMIYPDPDDIVADGGRVETYWDYFKDNFVAKVCATFNNQTEFNKLYCDGPEQIMDRWAWAAYYCLALRNCCVDSMVRNMELITFGEKNTYTDSTSAKVTGTNDLWLPKWWDVDMQCGLLQSGALGAEPRSTRNTKINNNYLFAGKNAGDGTSSWLWDGLEHCSQFLQDVNTIDALLYNNGWSYNNITDLQDSYYVKKWNESLFNESGLTKYINLYSDQGERRKGYEFMLQGDRTPHRHWFLRNEYSYFDALHICGDYADYVIKITPMYAVAGCQFHLYPSENNYYFGITHNDNDVLYSGIQGYKNQEIKKKNDDGTYEILRLKNDIGSKDTLTIFGVNKLEKIDISDFGKYLNGPHDLSKVSDSVLGTVLKELYLGSKELSGLDDPDVAQTAAGNASNSKTISFDGLEKMTRLETINIRGLMGIDGGSINSLQSQSLSRVEAAGSNIVSFIPKSGCKFSYLEFPNSVATISMDNCELPSEIKWYKTNTVNRTWHDTELNEDVTESSYYISENLSSGTSYFVPPSSLKSVLFTNMSDDIGAKNLILNWLHVVRDSVDVTGMTETEAESAYDDVFSNLQLTYTDAVWDNVVINNVSYDYRISYDDLILISRIPSSKRNLRGSYFLCKDSLTTSQMNTLMEKFGDYVFTNNSLLMIDSSSNTIKITVAGDNSKITEGVGENIPTIEVLQGCQYTFSGVVFPIKRNNDGSTIEFTWYFEKKIENSENYQEIKGTSIDTISPLHLISNTGVLTIDECSTAEISGDTLKIHVQAIVDNETKNGTAYLNVKRRTYPESVKINKPSAVETLNDIYQLTDSGSYTFSAEHYNPSDYTGTLSSTNGGIWNLIGYDTAYMSMTSDDTTYRLTINSDYSNFITEEKAITLMYRSNWKDYTKQCSISQQLNIISVINELLSSPTYDGNRALYYTFYDGRNGFTRTGGRAGYSSLDMKRGSGVLNFKEIIESLPSEYETNLSHFTTFKSKGASGTYNIARYIKNITALNLSGCLYFSDELDVNGMSTLTSVNMYGTSAGADLNLGEETWVTNVTYGTPTYIDITKPKYLTTANFNIQNTSLVKSIKLDTMKDNKEVSLLIDLINFTNTPQTAVLPSLTSVNINSSATNDYLGDSGKPLEQLYTLITEHPSLTSGSNINSTIKMKRIYSDTKNNVKKTFTGLTINNDEYYRRWNDRQFEICISNSSRSLGGDDTGLTLAQAATATSLGSAIKNIENIYNLSDLYYFEKLEMNSNDNEANSEFYGCTNIRSISIPPSATYIGKNTFTHKDALSSVDFSHAQQMESIKTGAFSDCKNSNVTLKFGTYGSTTICPHLKDVDTTGFTNASSIMVFNSETVTSIVI